MPKSRFSDAFMRRSFVRIFSAVMLDGNCPIEVVVKKVDEPVIVLASADSGAEQTFTDIYDDSMWLIGLVENLLSVTRLEEGRMNLNISVELVAEVIEEALNMAETELTYEEA